MQCTEQMKAAFTIALERNDLERVAWLQDGKEMAACASTVHVEPENLELCYIIYEVYEETALVDMFALKTYVRHKADVKQLDLLPEHSHPLLMWNMDAGNIVIQHGGYWCGKVCLGILGEETKIEGYLALHPYKKDWL